MGSPLTRRCSSSCCSCCSLLLCFRVPLGLQWIASGEAVACQEGASTQNSQFCIVSGVSHGQLQELAF